jgi:hypothetical protein
MVRAELFLQQKISIQAEDTAIKLLLVDTNNSKVITLLENSLESDLKRLIKNENRIFIL